MPKVLVPIDGSDCALRALKEALLYADNGKRAELHLLNVQLPLISGHARMFLSRDQLQGYYEEQGTACLASARQLLTLGGVPFVSEVKAGPVAQTIADYVTAHGCDHIVMGTRGHGAVAGLLMGSVTIKVIHLSSVPVMLVK